MVNNVFEVVKYESNDFEDQIEQTEMLAHSLYHVYQQRNPGFDLQQAVHHSLTLLLPIKDDPRHCTEIKCQALFDTVALHNSYIDSKLVKALRADLEPCIHQYRSPHAVILADNITMPTVNEYLLVPVNYVLNGKSHVVELRLTIYLWMLSAAVSTE